jgi:4-hydroxyacetophenone monooxygenase
MQDLGERELLERAVAEAHLPSLIVTLAQLAGRDDLLREAWRPRYIPYADPRTGGLSDAAQADFASVARTLIPSLIGRSPSDFDPPGPARLKALMDFVAGVEIPERYLPLLRDELGLGRRAHPAPAPDPRFKVLVIGAGMSGLLAGVKLKEAGYDFEILERSDDVGGTWHANTYPGCRVDSQNHLYCYGFHPNHDWPHRFSTQDALKAYFRGVADHYGLWDHIHLRTALESATFEEAEGLWSVRTAGPAGQARTWQANAVISAVGQLNRPKIPAIAGQDRFEGPQFHSATWRHDVDLAGKDVAVVGTGASAFQLIPGVAEQAYRLTVFQRSAPWVSPTPDYHLEVGEGQKWLFKHLPFYANWYRFWLFWTMTEGAMPALKLDPAWKADDGSLSASNQRIRNALVERMRVQIGDRVDLIEKVIPTAPFGGKRTLRDNGLWIETLKRDNVELVTGRIAELTERAVVTEDGVAHPADVVIYGTGFEASRFLEPARIVGRGGVELSELWAGDPRAYLGMTVPGFPNFFCIYGPNTNLVAQGSIVFFSECSVRYILGALRMLRDRGAATMEPKTDVHDAYNERVDAENAQMAWGLPGVTNWYKSETGRVSQNWPFPLVDYWNLTQAPEAGDFIFAAQTADAPSP